MTTQLQVKDLKGFAGTKYQDLNLDTIYRAAQRQELPIDLMGITYGIQYALDTQRLPGKVDYAVRNMKTAKLLKIIIEAHQKELTASDMPRYLIERMN
jgi:hypothetical protein